MPLQALHFSGGGKDVPLNYCQEGVEVWDPHLVSVETHYLRFYYSPVRLSVLHLPELFHIFFGL